MTIKPIRYDLAIYQAATLTETLPQFVDSAGVAVDLTGYTARAQAREDFDSVTPFMDISTANGGIILNGTNAPKLYISDDDTITMDVCNGVWDIILTAPDGTVIRYAQGKACVKKAVTRGTGFAAPAAFNFSINSNSQYLGVI
jgi:hypothetical protein